MVYTNENWFVILLSRVYFGDLVTEIYYFSPLNGKYAAQLRAGTHKNFKISATN